MVDLIIEEGRVTIYLAQISAATFAVSLDTVEPVVAVGVICSIPGSCYTGRVAPY